MLCCDWAVLWGWCALQSLYDPDQHQTNKTSEFINAHGKWLLATMNRTILQVSSIVRVSNFFLRTFDFVFNNRVGFVLSTVTTSFDS